METALQPAPVGSQTLRTNEGSGRPKNQPESLSFRYAKIKNFKIRYDNERLGKNSEKLDSSDLVKTESGDSEIRHIADRPKGFRIRYDNEPTRSQPARSNAINFRSNAPPKPSFRVPGRNAQISPRGSPREGFRQSGGGRHTGGRENSSAPRQRVQRSFQNDPEWNSQELDYLKWKEQSNIQPVATFQPKPVSQEILSGSGPALAVGELGMVESVQEKLGIIEKKRELDQERLETLARMRIGGMKVDCRSKQESEALEKRVQQILAGDSNPQPGDSHPIAEEDKVAFCQRLLGGEYNMRQPSEGDVAGDVERQAHRNTSYLPEDGKVLLQKFETLLPTKKAAMKEKKQAEV